MPCHPRRVLRVAGVLAVIVLAAVVLTGGRDQGEPSGHLFDLAGQEQGGEEAEEAAREQIARYVETHPRARAAAAAEPQYPSKNTDGEAGSGGTAVAYRANGRRVDASGAPDARLFRTGFGSWEPSIGITKEGTIYVAARNSNVDPGVARSADDGLTWTHSNPPEHQASVDPFVWVDRATGRVFTTDISPSISCAPTSFSNDGGKSWTTTRVCGHTDYQKLFGGPAPAGAPKPQGYPSVVYFCAISEGVGAQTSLVNSCSNNSKRSRN